MRGGAKIAMLLLHEGLPSHFFLKRLAEYCDILLNVSTNERESSLILSWMTTRNLKFIDLYAGLGGFHSGLSELGMDCVFASEIDQHLRENYRRNFGLECSGDIFKIQPSSIPDHNILCAGFPCQPFSKAGPQRGLEDEKNGKHIDVIASVLLSKKPDYFFLENVPNLLRQNSSATWRMVAKKLGSAGYDITFKVLSSEKYGSPQKRERLYIFGSKHDLLTFEWPEESDTKTYVREIIEGQPNSSKSAAAIIVG